MVLFMPMAFRCGYVGLPKESRFYQKEYDSIPVECHCGLTYASSNLYGQEDKDIWWIGFDCCHYCDGFDSEKQTNISKTAKKHNDTCQCLKVIIHISIKTVVLERLIT